MTKANDLTPSMLRTMCDTLPDMIWAKALLSDEIQHSASRN